MNRKIRWVTETAVLLALLVTLQYLTKPLGQLVTGSCVNAVLAISVLFAGVASGVTIAVISPVLAFLLGIAPQILTVPAILVGNTVYVLLLHMLSDGHGRSLSRQIAAWSLSALGKFAVLYLLVAKLICGVLSDGLIAAGAMKPAMVQALPATFGVAQLVTALIGGGVAMLIVPVLRKALGK